MADPRLTVVKMLMKMESSEAYSNLLLDHAFNEAELSDRDKAFAAALFYGVLERRLTLDHVIRTNSKIAFEKLDKAAVQILRTGLYQLLYMPSVPESAAVNESVKMCKKLKCFSAQGFVNGMLRSFIRSGKKISYLGISPEKRLSVEYSCPEWLTEKFISEYGMDFAVRALKASVGKPPVYARVNVLRTTTDKVIAELAKQRIKAAPYPGLVNCIRLEKAGDIEKCAPFRQGLFHVQDISSQLCCLTLRPVVNETVLDVCAAPGGKSFTLAELMGNNGKLSTTCAWDLSRTALRGSELRSSPPCRTMRRNSTVRCRRQTGCCATFPARDSELSAASRRSSTNPRRNSPDCRRYSIRYLKPPRAM